MQINTMQSKTILYLIKMFDFIWYFLYLINNMMANIQQYLNLSTGES